MDGVFRTLQDEAIYALREGLKLREQARIGSFTVKREYIEALIRGYETERATREMLAADLAAAHAENVALRRRLQLAERCCHAVQAYEMSTTPVVPFTEARMLNALSDWQAFVTTLAATPAVDAGRGQMGYEVQMTDEEAREMDALRAAPSGKE